MSHGPFIKTIEPASQFRSEQAAALVDVASTGIDWAWMRKRAAAGVFKNVDIKPRPGRSIIHLIAMGDADRYGQNANGDIFFKTARFVEIPEPAPGVPKRLWIPNGNLERHHTFTKYAKVYRNHKNKKTDPHYGDVVHSAHHDKAARVELLIDVPNNQWENQLQKLANGEDVEFSMSTTVPGDVCFPAGVLVTGAAGPVAIEEVEVGDLVLTKDSGYMPVEGVLSRQYTGDLFYITPAGLPAIPATDNHPFFVIRRDEVRGCHGSNKGVKRRHSPGKNGKCTTCRSNLLYRIELTPARDVRVGDYVMCPSARGDIDVTSDFAYALGVYAGDGHVISQRSGKKKKGPHKDMGVCFSVGDADPHLAALVSALSFCRNQPGNSRESNGKKASRLRVSDQAFARDVSQLVGRGSHDKTLAGTFSSEAVALSFLAGCIDSDGHVNPENGAVRFGSVSERLARAVLDVCASVGIAASLSSREDVVTSYGVVDKAWSVFIPASAASRLTRSEKVKRGGVKRSARCSAFAWAGFICREVRGVVAKAVTDLTVYNLDVSGVDETYVAGGVAVHNCTYCGNKAPSRKQYCFHAKKHMTEMLKSGHQVGVINYDMNFFDISEVVRRADRIALGLLKAASMESEDGSLREVGSFDVPRELLPEDMAAFEPFIRKLSEIEKRISVGAIPAAMAAAVPDALTPEDAEAVEKAAGRVHDVLGDLADLGIVLPLDTFLRVAAPRDFKKLSAFIPAAAAALPGVFTRMLDDGDFDCSDYRLGEDRYDKRSSVSDTFAASYASASIDNEPALRRATFRGISGSIPAIKQAREGGGNQPAEAIARSFAKYKVAFLSRAGRAKTDNLLTELLVLPHYL